MLKEISEKSSTKKSSSESTKGGGQRGLRIDLNEFRDDLGDDHMSATRCMIVLLQCAFERDEPDDVVVVESFCHENMDSVMPFPVGAVWCQLYMTKNKHDVPLASLSESLGFYQMGSELRVESKIRSEIESNSRKRVRYSNLLRLFVRSLRHIGKNREAELAIRSAPLTDQERNDVSKRESIESETTNTTTTTQDINEEGSQSKENEEKSSDELTTTSPSILSLSNSPQELISRVVTISRNSIKYIANRVRIFIESESHELRNSSGRLVQLFWFLVLVWLLSSQRRQIRLVLGRIFGSLRDDFSAVLR